ncbi:MAG: hypothetical protein V4646_02305 [Pseudomonadota bacterium]
MKNNSPLTTKLIQFIAIALVMTPLWSLAAPKKKPVPEFSIVKTEKKESAFDYIVTTSEWKNFPWDESGKSKLLAIPGYADRQDLAGNTISSLAVPKTPVGPISIDAYASTEASQPTHSKIVVNLVPDGVNQATCDDHQDFLARKFGKPMATRDVSSADFVNFSVQWVINNTIANWTCVGVNTPKRWSFITFTNSASSKLFSDLIPLSCDIRTRLTDDSVKTYQHQFTVDQYDGVIRRADNSLLTTASNVQISERKIAFTMTGSHSSLTTVEIDRATGRYMDTMNLPSLNVNLESTGSCVLFNPKHRKF